jgi:hypothetical protein
LTTSTFKSEEEEENESPDNVLPDIKRVGVETKLAETLVDMIMMDWPFRGRGGEVIRTVYYAI